MTVVGGRLSGKLSQKTNPRKILTAGLILAVLANGLIYLFGQHIWGLVLGVGMLGLGFIFTHSTLLTRATEFAMKARGAAMSLVAFCFMGGGGVGTAIGGKIAMLYGLSALFGIYGLALLVTLALSFILIAGPVVARQLVPSAKTP
jgi:predicted MFS family arabinose efflux permease